MKITWLGFMLLLMPYQAWSTSEHPSLSHSIVGQQLVMHGQIEVALPEEVRQAIEHEIPIRFKTHIQLNQRNQFLFFRTRSQVLDITYSTELSYSHFYKRYTLHNLRNQNRLHFLSLEDALHTLGRFEDFSLVDVNHLHAGLHYTLQVKIDLDWLKLPAPLISHALFNQSWFYSTGWLEQKILFGTGR
ncbi:DUF4390 domain-containing protein [Thiomicrospira sp. R3]|uniref:DUF4390 domain-containing protein n=1 Tax=Thiomicrospira sp. R3 TaxID=3035472 RepID=UPI00259B231A|nr:DUF4390 domain-containing protein [Thiomicrospira sp. R3]WFE69321.1 DUF4390 domain-containing protein [Thiomicrospira sp. R3]